MKKTKILALLLAIMLLQGCATGEDDTLPSGWSDSWVRVGALLGAEPMDGFRLDENKDALSINGVYYATWVAGDAREHTNEEGEAAKVYDAQIYVLLQQCRSAEAAKTQIGVWTAREAQSYTTGEESSIFCAGQEFSLLPLLHAAEDNPYSRGMAAFAVRGDMAICVELLCDDAYAADLRTVLEDFLSGFHYNDRDVQNGWAERAP